MWVFGCVASGLKNLRSPRQLIYCPFGKNKSSKRSPWLSGNKPAKKLRNLTYFSIPTSAFFVLTETDFEGCLKIWGSGTDGISSLVARAYLLSTDVFSSWIEVEIGVDIQNYQTNLYYIYLYYTIKAETLKVWSVGTRAFKQTDFKQN